MTKIKICGLMTTEDIEAVNRAKPDLAGFIFAAGRHQISLEQAQVLRSHLDSNIPSVGVFVNAPLEQMITAVRSKAVSIIQLHGQESDEVVQKLHSKNIPVIQVFKPDQIDPKTSADYIMIDTGAGNGKLLDWSTFKNNFQRPMFIAGALSLDNVAQAIQNVSPEFVDLSRGVETAGKKDPQKILGITKLVHTL